jgi:5-methylcytosine-specific restriction endonuclease McrA
MRSEEGKAKQREAIRRWQKANPEKVKAIKQRYYSSKKGKAQKRKEEANYVLTGGRAEAEKRRANFPISEARKLAKTKSSIKRRGLVKELLDFDMFVLEEAISLAKLREHFVGGKWHVDHIIPVSKGGSSQATNLQVVPAKWNQSKGTKTMYFLNASKR